MNPKQNLESAKRKQNQAIDELHESIRSRISDEMSNSASAVHELKGKISGSGGFWQTGLVISVVAAITICIVLWDGESAQQTLNSLGLTVTNENRTGVIQAIFFGTPALIFFAIGISGSIYTEIRNSVCEKEISKIEASRDAKIEKLRRQELEEIQDIQEECQREIDEYRMRYEKARRQDSIRYANSSVAQEVIQILSDGFKKHIGASDRRPHVEEIVVPFSFKVFRDKIESPYGTYDFKIERISELTNFDEQASLANAIAQNVHTEIITSYPCDISGGEIEPLEIHFAYENEYVEASMIYKAANKEFVPERSF